MTRKKNRQPIETVHIRIIGYVHIITLYTYNVYVVYNTYNVLFVLTASRNRRYAHLTQQANKNESAIKNMNIRRAYRNSIFDYPSNVDPASRK